MSIDPLTASRMTDVSFNPPDLHASTFSGRTRTLRRNALVYSRRFGRLATKIDIVGKVNAYRARNNRAHFWDTASQPPRVSPAHCGFHRFIERRFLCLPEEYD